MAAEEKRLKGMSELIKASGLSESLFEDFAEETFSLLQKVASALPNSDEASASLSTTFNDLSECAAIITHFRASLYPFTGPTKLGWAQRVRGQSG